MRSSVRLKSNSGRSKKRNKQENGVESGWTASESQAWRGALKEEGIGFCPCPTIERQIARLGLAQRQADRRSLERRKELIVHELGIVYHIIRDVENVARAHGVRRVSSVTLLLGEVSGVVPDLLLDAWRWAADKKPIAQGAELIVEPVEAVTHCEACGRDYATVEHGKTCPHCGSGETYLLQGQEVMIKQIETPDEDPADAAPDGLSDAPDAVDAANPLHIA